MDLMRFIGAGFTMQVPTSWLVISSGENQTLWLSPPLYEDAKQHANMALLIAQITAPETPEDYIKRVFQQQAERYPEHHKLAESEISAQTGETGYYQQSSWRNPQENVLVTQAHFYYINDNQVYLFTGNRPTDLADEDAQSIDELFAQMMDSLKFETIPMFS